MIVNLHERVLAAPPRTVGQLLDSLAGPDDRLWPRSRWPAMRFDRPLSLGALGGHGPIRYHVEAYTPGSKILFRFDRPSGFHGYHEFVLSPTSSGGTLLRHSLVMRTRGIARCTWPLVFRPLHDALVEDCFDQAMQILNLPVQPRQWSRHVLVLRAIARRGGA